MHSCTPYCTEDVEEGEVCSKRFPRVLSLYTHMSLRPRLATDEDKAWFSRVREFRSLLKRKMVGDIRDGVTHEGEDDTRVLLSLLSDCVAAPLPIEGGGFLYGDCEIPEDAWFNYHREKCQVFSEDEAEVLLLACYHYLTSITRLSYLVPRRRWESVRVPGYNPTLLSATRANGEVELIARSPGKLEHYVTKGSKGRDALMHDAAELDRRGGRVDKHAAARLRGEADAGRQETTLTEAFWCGLDRRLHPVRTMNLLEPVLVPTSQSMVVTLLKLRYAQRPARLERLSLVQFAMFYDAKTVRGAGAAKPTDVPVDVVSPDPDDLPAHLPPVFLTFDGHSLPLLKKPRPARLTGEDAYGQIVAYRVGSLCLFSHDSCLSFPSTGGMRCLSWPSTGATWPLPGPRRTGWPL